MKTKKTPRPLTAAERKRLEFETYKAQTYQLINEYITGEAHTGLQPIKARIRVIKANREWKGLKLY